MRPRLLVLEDDDGIRTALRAGAGGRGLRRRRQRRAPRGPASVRAAPASTSCSSTSCSVAWTASRSSARSAPSQRRAHHRPQRAGRHPRHRRGAGGRCRRLRDQALRGQGGERPAACAAPPSTARWRAARPTDAPTADRAACSTAAHGPLVLDEQPASLRRGTTRCTSPSPSSACCASWPTPPGHVLSRRGRCCESVWDRGLLRRRAHRRRPRAPTAHQDRARPGDPPACS